MIHIGLIYIACQLILPTMTTDGWCGKDGDELLFEKQLGDIVYHGHYPAKYCSVKKVSGMRVVRGEHMFTEKWEVTCRKKGE